MNSRRWHDLQPVPFKHAWRAVAVLVPAAVILAAIGVAEVLL